MKKDYYKIEISDIYQELVTNENGLTEKEASLRIQRDGLNKLQERPKTPAWLMFLAQFKDFMVILLICAAIFSAVVSYIQSESYIDSIIIILIVIINAILSFIQERKADIAIDELNKMFITKCFVIRNGKKNLIDVQNVVVGDILELEAGDYVSADARIIKSEKLEVNESTLTGESKSIKKTSETIHEDRELYERDNMIHAGCNITNGHAFAVVVKTAMHTELGQIANSLLDKKSDITPLQKRINQISHILTTVILIIIFIMTAIGIIKGNELFDVIMLSISLAVAAIPEGLSSIITIILSLGMTAMARRNVIIRKMASVETLGSTDIICSDKTGTITQNKMLVCSLYVNNQLYATDNKIKDASSLYECASYCQNVTKTDDKYFGDETEISIYKYLEEISELQNYSNTRLQEIPFDSDRKMMSVVIASPDKTQKATVYTKGSLDSVIENCRYYLLNGTKKPITDAFKKNINQIEEDQSAKSLRLLAFARADYVDDQHLEQDMTFIGLIGMMDPPRQSVYEAITTCQKAGIKPIMITGDSLNTACAIAKSVGIIDSDDKAIVAKRIDAMNDEELTAAVNHYQVYARISPNTKLKIVEALQRQGKVVAMTGDGVNDAPAIQKADIGIGMGITGTEVVKKVADCILVDDSFSTIVDGVEEGRRITNNIKKVILYLLAGNIIEVILTFISVLLNIELFTTLQLLWINLLTDSIPAIMLSFEKANPEIMKNNPENKNNKTFFTPFLCAHLIIGAIIKSTIILCLLFYIARQSNIEIATSMVFIFLIFHELLFALSCRNPKKNILNKNTFNNYKLTFSLIILFALQLVVLSSPLKTFLIVDNIPKQYFLITITSCFIVFIIGELLKPLYRKIFKDY